MQNIQISDQLYQEAQRRAAEAGFASVDEFVADVLTNDFQNDIENLDHLFTPQRLAHIKRSDAEIDAGQFFTSEEVREHFEQKRGA